MKASKKKKSPKNPVSFVYKQQYSDEEDMDQQSSQELRQHLIHEDLLPVSQNIRVNESYEILSQLNSKPHLSQSHRPVISYLEWAVQQSNHVHLINDMGSMNGCNKQSTDAPDVITNQRYQTILNFEKPTEQHTMEYFPLYSYNLYSKYFRVIEPSSIPLLIWNILMGTLIIFYFYLIALNVYFTKLEGDLEWFWEQWNIGAARYVHYAFTLLMTIDLIVEYHVAYFDKGSYVTNKQDVNRHYTRNGFVFAIIPLLMLYLIHLWPGARETSMLRYLFFLKIYQIKVYDYRFQDRLQLHRKSKAGYLIFKMVLELLMLVQIFASIFYRIGIYMMDKKIDFGDDEWDSWLDSDNLFPGIYERPILSQYFLSLYWSFATLTTVSYGDITPMNPLEIMVANCAMVGAIFTFAFNVQTIYEVYNEYQETRKKYQKLLVVMNRFMRDKQISAALQNKIRKYLDHIWERQRAREEKIERQIIDQLAPQLKQELMFESYGMDLLQIPWFSNNFSFEFIKQLSQDLQEVYYTQDEVIFKDKYQNEDDDAMYIIKEGEIELFIKNKNHNKGHTQIAHLKKGAVFGGYAFLTGDGRQCSAKSLAYTSLYKISRSTFLRRLGKFEADYERFCQLKDQVMTGKKLDQINIQCFTCNLPDHMASTCPLTHYCKKVRGDAKEYPDQNRRKFKRQKKSKSKKLIVGAKEYEDEDNPFVELEQYYQDNQLEGYEIDKVHSFQYYYPQNNIEFISNKQMGRLLSVVGHQSYFTPPLRHQVMPI